MFNRAILLATILLATVSSCSAGSAQPDSHEVAVKVVRIPIDSAEPSANGARLQAAWVLKSGEKAFGAFSGMAWDVETGRIFAVNDRGAWWAAILETDAAGVMTGLSGSQMGVLLDADGRKLKDKADADAEGAAWFDGSDTEPPGILISFERDHRVDLYRSFAGLPGDVPTNVSRAFPGLKSNSGLEGLATLADGRIVGVVEEKPKKGSTRGWISDRSRQRWTPFRLRASWGHRPTGLERAPGGGLLVLERMASPLTGVAAKVSWVPDPETVSEAVIPTRSLFTVQSPLPVDNFEGIAATDDGAGGVRVLLLSDDNFQGFQRTLLLQFHCPESCYRPEAIESTDGNRSGR